MENQEDRSQTPAEFTVETLESILLAEAEKRGERFYRISLSPHGECLFPWERLAVDIGRMETAFNVVRVSPDLSSRSDLPDRVVFHVTTSLPFERAAWEASARLDGVVDIVEIPVSSWKEEKARWTDDRPAAGHRSFDMAKIEAALLVLSYKILRFDMQRMFSLCGDDEAKGSASASMGRFEERLQRMQSSSIPFLVFIAGGRLHVVPRFLVKGYGAADGDDAARAGSGMVKPRPEGEKGGSRFTVYLESEGEELPVRADRLLSYREIGLSDIAIAGRVSPTCFEATVSGESCLLLLPEAGRR